MTPSSSREPAAVPWYRLHRRRPVRTERGRLDFETFFRARYRGLVRFLVVREAARWEDAEDAVEEAMSDAFLNWATIENPEAWVRRAARNALVTLDRRDRRRRELAAVAFRTAMPQVFRERLGLRQEAREVIEMLARLPDAQREVMAFRVDDYTPAEIAELIGKDPQTVRSNLRAARQALAAMIRSEAGEGADDQRR
jgi:RNA polymerase sigma factor (sigma-70 family)